MTPAICALQALAIASDPDAGTDEVRGQPAEEAVGAALTDLCHADEEGAPAPTFDPARALGDVRAAPPPRFAA